uniref:ADAMTS-like 1 n=1 Tax=Nothobranchius pienaari TaxID=704102 RepID=A0A1A8P9B5_9TELE
MKPDPAILAQKKIYIQWTKIKKAKGMRVCTPVLPEITMEVHLFHLGYRLQVVKYEAVSTITVLTIDVLKGIAAVGLLSCVEDRTVPSACLGGEWMLGRHVRPHVEVDPSPEVYAV